MATFIENVSYSPYSLLHNSFVLRHPFDQIVVIIIIIIIIIIIKEIHKQHTRKP